MNNLMHMVVQKNIVNYIILGRIEIMVYMVVGIII